MHLRRVIPRHVILSLGYVLLYLALNQPQIIFISRFGFTAWYPATGLSLALLLGVSPWYGPLVCVADALAGLLIYHQPLPMYSQTAGAVGLAGCYAGAAYLLRGPLRIDPELRRRQDIVRYLFVTITAAMAATSIGVLCLVADKAISWDQFWPSAADWFIGDEIGILAIAPFLLIQIFPRIRNWLSAEEHPSGIQAADERIAPMYLGGAVEWIGQTVTLLVVLWVVFGSSLATRNPFYLCFVPITWIAMRQGVRRVVIALLALNFGIVAAMHLFTAPLSLASQVGLPMLVVSAVGLIVGSAVTERHRIALELQEQTIYLNSLIENNPLGIAVLDRQGRVELTNAAFEKLFLYRHGELTGRDLDSILLPPGEATKSLQITQQVFAGEAIQTKVRRWRKDGTLLDLSMHGVPLEVNGRVRGAFTIYKDISEEIKASETERQHAESLSRLVKELRLRTHQMTLLNEMGDLLECCITTKEASSAVAQYVQKLFPEALSGTLYLFKSSRNVLEAEVEWGRPNASEQQFKPDACWALRRGQPYWSSAGASAMGCPHLRGSSTMSDLCVPMIAREDTLGILYLEFSSDAELAAEFSSENVREAQQRLATTVAGQIAFSLTSLRLRETLRDQSIRDSLTGLFNRRFMEESLTRELQRAARKKVSLALLFLDIDDFKRFNDNFGHDAGDVVLRSIAKVFLSFFRSDDVCCRYGGEEFAIIMPESTAEYSAVRANALRAEVKRLSLRSKDLILPTVTLSIGIAAFPEDGSSTDELLKVADRYLYQSNAAGRDTVTVATHQPI